MIDVPDDTRRREHLVRQARAALGAAAATQRADLTRLALAEGLV